MYGFLILAVAVASIGLLLLARGFDVLNGLDRAAVDAHFSIRGREHPPQNIVVVKIDDQTFNELNKRFPFPRGYHATVIDRLRRDGAKVIAYDVQFTEPSSDPHQDDLLILAVRRAGNVVLATTEVDRHGQTRIFGGGQAVAYSRGVPSDSNFPNDPGGVIRRMDYQISGLATLPVASAQLALGHRVRGPGKQAWIDYRGPPGTFRSISFSRVEQGRFPAGMFRGKIVVVGASAPSLQDLHPTSTTGSQDMAGAEIQANAIDTALRGFPLRPSAAWLEVILIIALGIAAPLAALRTSGLRALLVAAAAVGALALASQISFEHGSILAFGYPAGAGLLSGAGAVAVDLLTTKRQLRTLEESIDQLVDKLGPGKSIGDYRIEELVGRGGMGVVYRATQLSLNRTVALKVIVPELADDPEFRMRFQREALVAASIDHPNVVPVYETGEAGDLLFLAMRFIDGVDLHHLLQREGPLAPERAARVIEQVASALGAAHARGLVHRDVKPANVLVDVSAGDHVYLTDFGLTRRVDSASAVTQSGMMMGTLDYIPPEQIHGEEVDARADVYALGCVLYEMLTGGVPFERDSEVAKLFAHVSTEVPSARERRPELTVQIDEVIRRAMAKRPEERYPSAQELANAASTALREIRPDPSATRVSPPNV